MATGMGVLFVAVGAWSVCGGAVAPGVFMGRPKARAVAAAPGRAGAFFVALGAGVVGPGAFLNLAGGR